MAEFKVSYIFRSPVEGWSENYYSTAGDFAAALAAAADPPLVNQIALWRGLGITLQGVRVAETGGLRRAFTQPLNIAANGGALGAKDAVGTSIKCRLAFATGGGRTVEVRGAPDGGILSSAGGPSTVVGATLSGVYNMFVEITSGARAFRGQQLISTGTIPWETVVSYQAHTTNPSWTRFNVLGATPVPAIGDTIYLRGFNKATEAYLQGYFRVVDKSDAQFWFAVPTLYRGQLATMTPRNMQWREVSYNYPAFVSTVNQTPILRVGTRDTAGPFGQYRGKKSALSLRQ